MTTVSAVVAALFLIVIGIIHSVVNVGGIRRAIARGDISVRMGNAVIANAVFSGTALCILGLLVFLVLPGLRSGSRLAARVAIAIGSIISASGVAGYLWVPTKPSVLIFLAFGALLTAPLLIWRREFTNP